MFRRFNSITGVGIVDITRSMHNIKYVKLNPLKRRRQTWPSQRFQRMNYRFYHQNKINPNAATWRFNPPILNASNASQYSTKQSGNASKVSEWNSVVVPYGTDFSLLGGNDFREHKDLYIHCLQNPFNFHIYLMVNPRLKHYYALRHLHANTLRTQRPNINARHRDDTRWRVLNRLLQMATLRFGYLSSPAKRKEKNGDWTTLPTTGSSAIDFEGVYEQELWNHLGNDIVPNLDPKVWKKCVMDLNFAVYNQVFNVQYWLREHLSTHEVILDELDVIRELLSTPDIYLQNKIQALYMELFPKYGGHLAISSSEDHIFKIKESIEDWLIRYDCPTFEKQEVLVPTLPLSSQDVSVVEYPSYSEDKNYEFVSVSFQLSQTASELHSAILFYIQDKILNYKSPVLDNLTRILGIHPQSQNEKMYDPISRVLEFTFPIELGKNVPANEIANLISASLRFLASNDKLVSTFIQEVITKLELDSMKNKNHFNQWCEYAEYRRMRPLGIEHDFDIITKDPFYNKKQVIQELKNDGKKLLQSIVSNLVSHRTTVIYRPSAQWKNRIERSLQRILKDDPNKRHNISTKMLRIQHPDALQFNDIDPPFHNSSFSLPSEVVHLSPSVSVVFDYTSRGDLVDLALVTVPRVSPSFFSNPLGFTAFMCDLIGFLGANSSPTDDFYKDGIKWTSGVSSYAFTYLKPFNAPKGSDLGGIPSLLFQATCAEKTFHFAVDQMVNLITATPLLDPEKMDQAEVRLAGQDFCAKQLQNMLPVTKEMAMKQGLVFTPSGFVSIQLYGITCLPHVQSAIQEPPAPPSDGKVTQEMKVAQEVLMVNMKHFAAHYLHHPLKRIFLVTADLKHRNSLLSELQRVQSKLSTQTSEDEMKKLEHFSSQVLMEVGQAMKREPRRRVFIEYPKEVQSEFVVAFTFDSSNVLNSTSYAHGLIFAELLHKVLQQNFSESEDNEFFESLTVEQNWSGALQIAATIQTDASLSYFFNLVEDSLNWMVDESNVNIIEKMTDICDVYARSCKKFEAHHEEFERTFTLFDLIGYFEPQDVKDILLSKAPIGEVIQTMKQFILKSNPKVDLENVSTVVYGCKKPQVVTRDEEKWTLN